MIMMAFGLFLFGLKTVPYQKFTQQIAWRHQSTSRIGARAGNQYLGVGEETITLSGTAFPGLSKAVISIDLLKYMADKGEAWPLIEGTARIYGFYVATSLAIDKSEFFKDGAARKIEFSISLKRVDNTRLDQIGAISAAVRALL